MKQYNKDMLVGATVSNVCKMSAKELEVHGWDDNRGFNPVYVIELDNGISLYPSRDGEGNGGGVLFGVDENDLKCFTVYETEDPSCNGGFSKHGEEIKVVDTSKMDNDEFGKFLRGECV